MSNSSQVQKHVITRTANIEYGSAYRIEGGFVWVQGYRDQNHVFHPAAKVGKVIRSNSSMVEYEVIQ